ncbi:unnamed protein product [Zymoseptoria tritici ST99CH_3D7]|uniref:BTB domain-containing protein n=1 Tax=Zymoseptoria tritici (strain ST99CH_3D7) TaxID=1276538 RepID=A0A1X7RPT0_ZYMT9|nr:unnamed protein product [Zymoseptoria tritici ST99CH_3D7]
MNQFPTYSDGDVKVIISSGRHYQLHSNFLRNSSPVLRKLLRDENAADLSSKAIKKNAVRFQLTLTPNKRRRDNADIKHVFALTELDRNGRAIGGSTASIVESENGRAIEPNFLAFDRILRAFYNQGFDFGDAQEDHMTDLLNAALETIAAAEYLKCVHVISGPIEATLLSTGQSLQRALSLYPPAWLMFAERIKSRAIFKQALIHGTGQYNMPVVQNAIADGSLSDSIIAVLEKKAQAVVNGVAQAQRCMASYYPAALMREKTIGRVDRDNIGRADYGNDILMWIALCVFRHWLSDQLAADHTHHAPDMGYQLMSIVNQGGNAYLSRQVLQHQFHARFPMSPKGMACVEHRLMEIKNNVAQWAAPLMVDDTELDTTRYPVKHYTHIRVDVEDYPWAAAETAAQAIIAAGGKAPVDDEPELDEEEEVFLESSDSEMGENAGSDDVDGEDDTGDEDAMET